VDLSQLPYFANCISLRRIPSCGALGPAFVPVYRRHDAFNVAAGCVFNVEVDEAQDGDEVGRAVAQRRLA